MDPDASDPSWYVPIDGNMRRFAGVNGLPALHLIPYRDSGGEQILRLCEDSTGLLVGPSDRRLPPIGVYVSQLRGEAHHRQACRIGDFSPGAPVRLVHEPDNPYDRNAVAVYDATGAHLAAYVNKSKARMLAKLLASGMDLQAVSLRGTGAGKACDQVAVLPASPAIIPELLAERPSSLPAPAHLRRG